MSLESPDPIAEDLLGRLALSPDVYPQKLDPVRDAVLLVRLDRAAYRTASFLDDRILTQGTEGAWVPLIRIAASASRVTGALPLHFIFHTGHVGSTLASRLLEESGSVLGLREPLPLRTLAEIRDGLDQVDSLLSIAQFDAVLSAFIALWSRGYHGTRGVIVKATSSSARLAPSLLERSPHSRAIYMNLRAEPYLATLLAGQNSPSDLRGHGPERIRRLRSRVATPLSPLHSLSLGELAALSWLAESWTQRETLKRFAGRVIPLDFDDFLAQVEGSVRRIVGHFNLPIDDRALAAVARSPVLTRYSKAPEFAYTPALRTEVLRDARRDHRDEIRKGLQWLERLGRVEPAVQEVLDASG